MIQRSYRVHAARLALAEASKAEAAAEAEAQVGVDEGDSAKVTYIQSLLRGKKVRHRVHIRPCQRTLTPRLTVSYGRFVWRFRTCCEPPSGRDRVVGS